MKTYLFIFLILGGIILLSPACQTTTTPTVTTNPITNITLTSADGGGDVSDDGGDPITARGLCWSTNPGPTIADQKTSEATDIFTSNMTGLNRNTSYYVRAYATNIIGTSYGNEMTFSTLTFANTKWEINLIDETGLSVPPYYAQLGVKFNSDGTTSSWSYDHPNTIFHGPYWTLSGNTITWNPGFDPQNISYIFTGIISGNTIVGTYPFAIPTNLRNFNAVLLP